MSKIKDSLGPDTSAKPAGPEKPKHPASPEYYRFGICGLNSSGKTCLLAALAMPRLSHPKGCSVSAIPLQTNPSGPLRDGWDWINQARAALEAGGVPEANPHTGDLLMRYSLTDGTNREVFLELKDYSGELLQSNLSETDIADNLRRFLIGQDGYLFVAEHPKPGETAADLAGQLDTLKKAFSLLQFEKKKQNPVPAALLINKWDRRGTPLKGENAHDQEMQALDEFLHADPLPPHRGLLSSLQGTAGGVAKAFPVSAFGAAKRTPAASGGFIEKPVQITPELLSFGLEEPFLWLVEQRDRMDAEQIERDFSKPAEFCRHLLVPMGIRKLALRARSVMERMAPTSPERKRVATIASHCRWFYPLSFVPALLLVLLGLLAFEWRSDHSAHARAKDALKNPSDNAALETALDWYHGYASANPFRHLLYRMSFPREQAAEERQQVIDTRRKEEQKRLDAKEQTLWKNVENQNDPALKKEALDLYLKEFPSGRHAENAKAQLREIEIIILRARLSEALKYIGDELAGLQTTDRTAKNIPEIEESLEALDKKLHALQEEVPKMGAEQAENWSKLRDGVRAFKASVKKQGRDIETDDLRSRFGEELKDMEDKLARLQANLLTAKDIPEIEKQLAVLDEELQELQKDVPNVDAEQAESWSKLRDGVRKLKGDIEASLHEEAFRKSYAKLKGEGKWLEAAEHLAKGDPAQYADLFQDYKNNALTGVKRQADSLILGGREYEKGLELIKTFRDNRRILSMMPESAPRELDSLKEQIKEKGDRYYYGQIAGGFDPQQAARTYLEKAPLQTMASDVNKWLDFKKQLAGPNKYRLGISKILWSEGAKWADNTPGTGETTIELEIGANKAKHTFQTPWKGDEEMDVNKFNVEAAGVIAKDMQQIRINIEDVDWPDANDKLGHLQGPFHLYELHKTVRELNGADAGLGPNRIVLSLEILEDGSWKPFKEPPLPSTWSSAK